MEHTFLWKLTYPAIASPSYLLGTMHVRDDRAFLMQRTIQDCIDACGIYAAESNINELRRQQNFSYLNLANRMHIPDLFEPHQFEKLHRIIDKAFGIGNMLFSNKKPILIAYAIDQIILDGPQAMALDDFLWSYGILRQKELTGVEPGSMQRRVILQIPLEQQVKQLLSISKNVSAHRKNVNKMADLYAGGRLRQVYLSTKRGLGDMRRFMLYERNIRMAKRIFELMNTNSSFCAIGAAHLPGKYGVLRYLKKEGVQLQPIPWVT